MMRTVETSPRIGQVKAGKLSLERDGVKAIRSALEEAIETRLGVVGGSGCDALTGGIQHQSRVVERTLIGLQLVGDSLGDLRAALPPGAGVEMEAGTAAVEGGIALRTFRP